MIDGTHFFSDDFNFDISIALISSNLKSKVLASGASAGFGAAKDVGSATVAAFS